jgi:pimeloyl-ACP methyl ester carboxylesterase
VLIELQNHGRSARHSRGASWGCQERWDVIAVLNQLEQTYPAAPILLAATSMGTIASTQAAITSPATFAPVRAMVYESPVSLIDSLFSGVGQRLDLNDSTINKAYKFLTTLSQLRTDVDFAKCAKRLRAKNRQVEIPTLLQISATEYELPAERSFFDTYPFHSRVQVKVYKRGSHSAYWNYQPEEFEVDLENFWQRHQTVPPAAKHELSTPAQGS